MSTGRIKTAPQWQYFQNIGDTTILASSYCYADGCHRGSCNVVNHDHSMIILVTHSSGNVRVFDFTSHPLCDVKLINRYCVEIRTGKKLHMYDVLAGTTIVKPIDRILDTRKFESNWMFNTRVADAYRDDVPGLSYRSGTEYYISVGFIFTDSVILACSYMDLYMGVPYEKFATFSPYIRAFNAKYCDLVVQTVN
jgi:hypothetical protein